MKKTTMTLILFSFLLFIGSLGVSASGGLTSLQLRAQAHEKAVELRENRLENKLIWANNVELRTQIKLTLKDIKDNDIVLEDSVKTQLAELTATLKTKYALLKETKGDIRALTDGIKALIEAKDWASLKTTYESILAIQLTRNSLLSDINAVLNQIIDVLP